MLVVDAIMGKGKSSWAIREINKCKNKRYLYVTPFISECDRVSAETGIFTPMVTKDDKRSKLQQAVDVIELGFSLVITHSLFLKLPKSTVSSLNGYNVIIDEALTTCTHIAVSTAEVESMLRDGALVIEEECENYKRLAINTPDSLKNTALLRFHHSRIAGNSELLFSDNNLLMMLLPSDLFNNAENVTMLTYDFAGSDFDCYLQLRGITPTVVSLKNGELVDYYKQDGSDFKHLVTVIDNPRMNETKTANRGERFTKRWYGNLNAEGYKQIKNNLGNFFNRCTKTTSDKNLWTIFQASDMKSYLKDEKGAMFYSDGKVKGKNVRDLVMDKPYRQVGNKKFCYDFSHLDYESGDLDFEAERKRMVWLPLNVRGTNLYADRTAVAYMVNLNLSPALTNFFNCTIGREPDNDLFATSMMIQFIFRSAIRNGQPITVYIPSLRMRHLFLTWLGYSKEELF